MKKIHKKFKYIYGPVSSWRMGSSLGIDLLSHEEKICTFDCTYCQIGKTGFFKDKREIFVPTDKLMEEVRSLAPLEIDYVTFSGRGEPTLAKNLGEAVKEVKKIRKEKIAIITNSSLIDRKDVQEDLSMADLVIIKLDAPSEKVFSKINKPAPGIIFDKILKGIKEFKIFYKGKLSLQIMFIDENKSYAEDLAKIASEITFDEVQINTPLRPCGVRPLEKEELEAIKGFFRVPNIITVYEGRKKSVKAINKNNILKRRGDL